MPDEGLPSRNELERELARALEEADAAADRASALRRMLAERARLDAEAARLAAEYRTVMGHGGEEPAERPAAPARATPDPPTPQPHPAPSLSVAELAKAYLEHPQSPYGKLRPASQSVYSRLIGRIMADCENVTVADLSKTAIIKLYQEWAADGKVAIGHALITMLRGLVHFGMNVLENAECGKVSFDLHNMRFKGIRPKRERMTEDQANAIRAKAHELGYHTIALAQAFQFECRLMQKDVIGEWVPAMENTKSQITGTIRGSEKWVRGLCWNEISEDWQLKHPPSVGGDDIEIDLKNFPVVMNELTAEIRRLGKRPKIGPIIVKEDTSEPYSENTFRWAWRKVADAAGVPSTINNRDSRPTAWSNRYRTGSKQRAGVIAPARNLPSPERGN